MPDHGSSAVFKDTGAIRYTWPLSRHLIRFAPWLVLGLLVFARANREPGVWKVVVPAAVLQGAVVVAELSLLDRFWDVPMYMLDLLVVMAFSLSTVSLLLLRNARSAANAAAMVVLVGMFYLLCWMGLPPGFNFFGMTVLHGLMAMVVVIALAVARRTCRNRFTWRRFHTTAGLTTLALCLAPTPFVLLVAFAILTSRDVASAVTMLTGGLATLAGTGAGLYLLLATYLAITRRAPALMLRFHGILGLGYTEPPPITADLTGVAPGRKEIA